MNLEDIICQSHQNLSKYFFIHHASLLQVFTVKDEMYLHIANMQAKEIIKSDIEILQSDIEETRKQILDRMRKYKVRFFFFKIFKILKHFRTYIKTKLLILYATRANKKKNRLR